MSSAWEATGMVPRILILPDDYSSSNPTPEKGSGLHMKLQGSLPVFSQRSKSKRSNEGWKRDRPPTLQRLKRRRMGGPSKLTQISTSPLAGRA